MNIWQKLPIKSGSGGIWESVTRTVEAAAPPKNGLGIWDQVSNLPGGVWSAAESETLLLRREDQNVWSRAADETVVLDRGKLQDLWKAAQQKSPEPSRDASGVWSKVDAETLVMARPSAQLGSLAQGSNIATFRPVRALGWALKKLSTAGGEEYYVLKNLRQETYLRLNEQQVYLWNLMDGSHNVQDLAVANFLKYKTLSIDWLTGYLAELKAKGFLVGKGVNVYSASGFQLWRRTWSYWWQRLINLLFQAQVSIKGIDRYIGAIYRRAGWVFFTRPLQFTFLIITVLGLPAFFYVNQQSGLSFLTGAGDSVGFGVIGVLVAELFAVFTHELSHALTTKHYGRQVRHGGVGLYFGMVAFFVDTTDIWMERRGPRLAVTWAGPYSGFILGGMASLAIFIQRSVDWGSLATSLHHSASLSWLSGTALWLHQSSGWTGLAYQFATFCFAISFLNLNPLLKLDGYYILMDWLEMPRLRERSMDFVREKLLKKLRGRESFKREEKIFAVFGVLALAWTGLAIFSMIEFYGAGLFGLIEGFVGTQVAWAAVVLLAAYLVITRGRQWLFTRRFRRA